MSLGGTDVMNDTKIGLDTSANGLMKICKSCCRHWHDYRQHNYILLYVQARQCWNYLPIGYLQLYYLQHRLETNSSLKKFLGNKVVQLVYSSRSVFCGTVDNSIA